MPGWLVEGTHGFERVHDATGDLGGGLLFWVRATVALHHRLGAEHGDEAGPFIWRAAMDRHRRWLRERYGLRDA